MLLWLPAGFPIPNRLDNCLINEVIFEGDWNNELAIVQSSAFLHGDYDPYVKYPVLELVSDRPIYTLYAGPCSAGIFMTQRNAYLFHILPKMLERCDHMNEFLFDETGLHPENILGGYYGSSAQVMACESNKRLHANWNLTPVFTPNGVFSIDWLVDPRYKRIAYHFNY